MAPNPHIIKAFRAMKDIGICYYKTKPVLKRLMKLYDKNWELIEAENYRVLADAIFEEEDSKVVDKKKSQVEDFGKDVQVPEEPERPLKRLRLRGQETQVDEIALKTPKLEEDVFPETDPSSSRRVEKGKAPVSSRKVERVKKHSIVKKPSAALRIKEPTGVHALLKPKDEPITDDALAIELPIASIHPDSFREDDNSIANDSAKKPDDQVAQMSSPSDRSNKGDGLETSSCKKITGNELATVTEELHPQLEIASSPLGEEGSICRIPLLDAMKNSEPMKSPRTVAKEENLDPPSPVNEPVSIISDRVLPQQVPSVLESSSILNDQTIRNTSKSSKEISNGHFEDEASKELDNFEAANQHNMMVVSQSQQAVNGLSFSHNGDDITKGEERVQVSWVNEINKEHPPFFHYIPRSLTFQSAFVNFSLSLIGNDNCCRSCFGNCLTSSVPCACARETGAKYAYTPEGLIKEEFLEECISLARDPQGNHQFYCKECPLETSKNDDCLEPCKGHLKKKLIKECWSKCSCNKQCGNRVVQRGINCKLQIFFTSEGKGWGLRTLEDLPKGAFVCEYAGEILTIPEMYHRKLNNTENGELADPVLLDAFWNKKGPENDEKALCLDATNFGNVARFINHRCFDANLVDVAVEIESPDHHYYHVALFTTRKIDAMEELTLDFNIDFDDVDHPVKSFLCQCGSKFCRNMKRTSRRLNCVMFGRAWSFAIVYIF